MKKQSMKIPRFRTWYNHPEIPYHAEYNSGELVTIPYQSYTIREIFEKFAQGQPLPIGQNGSFEEDPDIDNPLPYNMPDFDLADLTELQSTNSENITRLRKRLKDKELSLAGLPEAPPSKTMAGTTESRTGDNSGSSSLA